MSEKCQYGRTRTGSFAHTLKGHPKKPQPLKIILLSQADNCRLSLRSRLHQPLYVISLVNIFLYSECKLASEAIGFHFSCLRWSFLSPFDCDEQGEYGQAADSVGQGVVQSLELGPFVQNRDLLATFTAVAIKIHWLLSDEAWKKGGSNSVICCPKSLM